MDCCVTVTAMAEAQWLMFGSTVLVGGLGAQHLLLTFFGSRLRPRDPALPELMQGSALILTSQTTVWRAWIGFNASHSLGACLFALLYAQLAWQQPALLFTDVLLQAIGGLWLAAMLVLAGFYWFRVPFAGLAVALLMYLAAIFSAGV